MTPRERAQIAKEAAGEAGFALVGVTSAEPMAGFEYYRDWLAAGRAGAMEYLQRNVHFREKPGELLADARSILCVAMSYNREDAPPFSHTADNCSPNRTPCAKQGAGNREDSTKHQLEIAPNLRLYNPADPPVGFGKVARYARGRDYHSVLKRRLYRVIELLQERVPEPFEARPFVDTGPILERQLAARAGLGWIGKNTLLMNAKLGTYLFLGEIITTLELEPDGAVADHCGTCTRCLDACPTQAFPAAYQMDASRCISYLTIEHRDEIPQAFHKSIGDWVYGCDICQEVCPHNSRAPIGDDDELMQDTTPAYVPLPLLENLTSGDYRRLTKNSAARRATRGMWERNGEIVRGNKLRRKLSDIRQLRKADLNGTCYIEFLPGRFSGHHWSTGSVYLSEDVFQHIEGIFERHIPGFDHFSLQDVGRPALETTIIALRAHVDDLLRCDTQGELDEQIGSACSTSWSIFAYEYDGDWRCYQAELVGMIRALTDWLEEQLAEHEFVAILGL